METFKSLDVLYHGRKVGTLALYQRWLGAFQYDADWLLDGFSISPFTLPLDGRVFIPKYDPFEGLFGVFADSLPDGWGRLLVDRMLLKEHEDPNTINALQRLAIVGESGMGALTYRPSVQWQSETTQKELDYYAEECSRILKSAYSEDLDELFRLGGSSGGARPKIMTEVDGEDWIIKFPSAIDGPDIGRIEYEYSQCAKKCGIEMSETRLFPSKTCDGYFGTKRFDRRGTERIHMLSASALLEHSHRLPTLDYHTLMKLTLALTQSYKEVEKLYRLMCFNVFAHNRDDHAKNFAFLYEPETGWRLAPAYDLTYSNSTGGEHVTTVNGNGSNPSLKELYAVAESIGLSKEVYKHIVEQVQDTVEDDLNEFYRYGERK